MEVRRVKSGKRKGCIVIWQIRRAIKEADREWELKSEAEKEEVRKKVAEWLKPVPYKGPKVSS